MVSRASGGLGDDTVEPPWRQIQFVDERFNNPDRVVLRHVVTQAVRQQRSLPSSPSTKRFTPPSPNSRTLTYHLRTFSHALGHEGRFAWARLSAGCGFRKETVAGIAMSETRTAVVRENSRRLHVED